MRDKGRSVLGAMFGILRSASRRPFRICARQNLDKPTWPTLECLTSTPEEQGMDSSVLISVATTKRASWMPPCARRGYCGDTIDGEPNVVVSIRGTVGG
jgi:hypothetical protein